MRGTTLERGEQARPGHTEDHSAAHVLGYARSYVFGPCETLCSSNRPDVLEGESRSQTFVHSFQVWMRLSPQSANIYESLFSRAQNKRKPGGPALSSPRHSHVVDDHSAAHHVNARRDERHGHGLGH